VGAVAGVSGGVLPFPVVFFFFFLSLFKHRFYFTVVWVGFWALIGCYFTGFVTSMGINFKYTGTMTSLDSDSEDVQLEDGGFTPSSRRLHCAVTVGAGITGLRCVHLGPVALVIRAQVTQPYPGCDASLLVATTPRWFAFSVCHRFYIVPRLVYDGVALQNFFLCAAGSCLHRARHGGGRRRRDDGLRHEHHVDLNRIVADDGIRVDVGLSVKLGEEPFGGRQMVQDPLKGIADMLDKCRVASVQLASGGNTERGEGEGK